MTNGLKAPYELALKPLTKRAGPFEKQVIYASQLAEAGDLTAKGVLGFVLIICRGSTLEVQRDRGSRSREERYQPGSNSLLRRFGIELSKKEIDDMIADQIDMEQSAFQDLLSICSESKVRKGVEWLTEIGMSGQAGTAALIAQAMHEGMGGLQRDPNRALFWAKKAIEGDHPHGYRILGELYFEGKAVPANKELAIENWEKAARYGDMVSQSVLSKLGDGVWHQRCNHWG